MGCINVLPMHIDIMNIVCMFIFRPKDLVDSLTIDRSDLTACPLGIAIHACSGCSVVHILLPCRGVWIMCSCVCIGW